MKAKILKITGSLINWTACSLHIMLTINTDDKVFIAVNVMLAFTLMLFGIVAIDEKTGGNTFFLIAAFWVARIVVGFAFLGCTKPEFVIWSISLGMAIIYGYLWAGGDE